MQKLHYCLGLPRSGSTVLMNILNENPKIFTTGTCPIPYFINACREVSTHNSEFIAMDKDVSNEAYINFLRSGIKGWFESITKKSIVISKSRGWAQFLNHTLLMDENSKYIVILRDLRDIICSLDKLLYKYPNISIFGDNQPQFHIDKFDDRINRYCFDKTSTLGGPLSTLPHVVEIAEKNSDKFLFVRIEDFDNNPKNAMKLIYGFIGEELFEHDINNIPRPDYYEHDNVYRASVSHKTGKKFNGIKSNWSKILTLEQSQWIVDTNRWYYELFYPEFL